MKKLLISVCSLTLCLFFALFCSCSNSTSDVSNTEQTVEALTRQIEELERQLEQLQNTCGQDKSDFLAQIELQQEQIDLLQAQIENLSGTPVRFTEQSPAFSQRETEKTIVNFESYADEENPDAFDEFYNYIQDELSGMTDDYFLVLKACGENIDGSLPLFRRDYSITALGEDQNGMLIGPMVNENIYIFDKVLGDNSYDYDMPKPGTFECSLRLSVFLSAIPEELADYKSSLLLKFGNNGSLSECYINIYFGKTCIGTCYYESNAYVSENWFLNYFRNNLLFA